MWIGSFSLHIWQERCRISRVYWCGSIDLTSISLLLKFSINHFQMCRNRSLISIKSMQTIWDYFNGVLCGFFLTVCICGIFTIVFKAVLQTAKQGSFIIHYGTKYIQWRHLSNYMIFFSHSYIIETLWTYRPICTSIQTRFKILFRTELDVQGYISTVILYRNIFQI